METRTFRLDTGVPVLIVGATHNDAAYLSRPEDRGPEPWIVLMGTLAEPYVPGQAVLLADGPMAGSVHPRGIVRIKAAEIDGAKIFDLERRDPDERGAVRYIVLEDRTRVSAILERDMLAWPMPLAAAATIKKMVKQAYGWASPWYQAWSAAAPR